MNSINLKYFMVLLLSFIMIGCDGNSSSESELDGLKIDKITLSSSEIPLNSIQLVKVTINSPIDFVSEANKTAAFIYFELIDLSKVDTNTSDTTIWLDSFALSSIREGNSSYEFNITMPSDIDIGQYALYAEVSNHQNSLDTNSSDAFDVIGFGGKPELELVSFKLGIEDGGIDSEYDTINSYKDAGISKAQEMLEKGISLDDLNKTLIIDASIAVRSHYMSAEDVKVKVCVEVYSECIPIPFLDMIESDALPVSHATEEAVSQSPHLPIQTFQLSLGDFDENAKKNFDLHIVLSSEQFHGIINDAIQDLHAFSGGTIQGRLKVEISASNEGDLDLAANIISHPLNIRLSQDIYSLISNLQSTISLEDFQAIVSLLNDSNISGGFPGSLPDGLPGDLPGEIPTMSIKQSLVPTISPIQLAKSTSGTCGLKKLHYEREYDYHKYGKRFGAGAYLKGKAYLDAKGVHSNVYGALRVRRFSDTKWRILRVKSSANIIPASFEDTGYDIEISSLGLQIYSKSNSISQALGLDSPTVTLTEDEEEKIRRSNESNATDRNVTRRSTLLRQKAYKAAKKKIKQYGETQSTLLSYTKGWRVGKIIERSTTIWFGPVPIIVTAGADASIGFDAGIKLDGITSVTAMVEPNAYIGAYLQAGVGWGVSCCGKSIEYSAGFGGNLWLISERFTTTVNASLEFAEDDEGKYIVALDGKLHNNITNYLSTMKGEIYAYAKYTKWICKYRRHPCKAWDWQGHCTRRGSVCSSYGWKDYYKKKTFADWQGGKYTREILDKKRTLFTVPIADNCE